MQVIGLEEIQPQLDRSEIIHAVRQGFIQHARGDIETPAPIQMLFGAQEGELTGDCHIKTAFSNRFPYFCIKVATGFYGNPARGLDVNNGLFLLLSAETGTPLALLQDEGRLTAARTSAAGVLAASLAKEISPKRLGVIGTGQQAEQQARWIAGHIGAAQITVFGRSADKAAKLVSLLSDTGIASQVAASAADLCAQSDIIVTTTPATSPVLMSADVGRGKHIIAVGADSLGKNELDPQILARADVIITDDHKQSMDHGEFGTAVRAGLVEETEDLSLGAALADPEALKTGPDALSVVDLTGLGAQDLAIASLIYEKLAKGTGHGIIHAS